MNGKYAPAEKYPDAQSLTWSLAKKKRKTANLNTRCSRYVYLQVSSCLVQLSSLVNLLAHTQEAQWVLMASKMASQMPEIWARKLEEHWRKFKMIMFSLSTPDSGNIACLLKVNTYSSNLVN
jgi:hypothetical protein